MSPTRSGGTRPWGVGVVEAFSRGNQAPCQSSAACRQGVADSLKSVRALDGRSPESKSSCCRRKIASKTPCAGYLRQVAQTPPPWLRHCLPAVRWRPIGSGSRQPRAGADSESAGGRRDVSHRTGCQAADGGKPQTSRFHKCRRLRGGIKKATKEKAKAGSLKTNSCLWTSRRWDNVAIAGKRMGPGKMPTLNFQETADPITGVRGIGAVGVWGFNCRPQRQVDGNWSNAARRVAIMVPRRLIFDGL